MACDSAASERGSTPTFQAAARSISQELVRERDQSLTERWTDSLRKSRDRLRKRFSLKDERRPASEPAGGAAAEEDDPSPPLPVGSDGQERRSRRDGAKRADVFLQPVRRFGKVASRSAVGKPVVRFAKTCRRDVPKPYRFIRDKLRSRSSEPQRLRSDSPRPRSLSPSNGGSNNEDEIVFAFGTAKEQEEHIYDPVGEPPEVDRTIRDADDEDDADDVSPVVEEPEDDFSRFSRFSKTQYEPEPARKTESARSEPEQSSRTPTPCLKDTSDSGRNSRPGSRSSRTEDFPKSVRFGKKRVSDGSDSVGVRFKPLSTSSSQDEDVGSYHGLQRVRVQLKDDATGLNIVSKFAQQQPQQQTPPQPDVVALPPIEIRQLDEPPRVLRPRSNQSTPESPVSSDTTPVFTPVETTPPVSASTPTEPARGKKQRALPSWASSSKPAPAVVPNDPPPPPPAAVAGPSVTPVRAAVTVETTVVSYEEPEPDPEPEQISESSPPEITLTTDCRPPRPPPPAPETLERCRRPLQAIDNIQKTEPKTKEPPAPREPYQPKIREYAESRRALTLKPPRKKKRSDATDPRSQSADQADRADERTIAIFGTVTRPARTKRRGVSASAVDRAPISREPPPRPPPPAPRRPPRGRSGSRGRRAAVSLNDVRYADESATEESADYGDGRSYRRLLDDADQGPYRPTRSLTRPARRSLPQSTVTGRLVVGGGQIRVQGDEETPPARPSRGGRGQLEPSARGHNDTFDSIGEGPDAAHETVQHAPGSVTSEGPRSLHSFQQEELGSGDELMLIVHDSERDGQGDSGRREPELCLVSRQKEGKENQPEGDRESSPEVQLRKLTPGRPEYAHVRKRSSLLLREQEANYDYPPPVPKKLNDLRPSSPSAPPRRRPASLSPGRAGLDGNTTWPKRRHTTAPADSDVTDAPVAPPPRTVRRSKVRSSTVPRGFKANRSMRPTLYHLAKEQRSQEDGVDMKNRPLPPPPPPPRKKPSGYSNPSLNADCVATTEAPVVVQMQTQETAPAPLPVAETPAKETPAVVAASPAPPAPEPEPVEMVGVSPAGSDQELSSQATDAPSEITLRSEGSQATLTSGRDPGCESTDDEFFSMANEVDGRRRTPTSPTDRGKQDSPASGSAKPPGQQQLEKHQQQQQQAGLVAAAPRHVLVPHFIQRVSTSEMDAASANILDLTAGRIKVTELEVDRIYIREGRVKLICHEEGSDDEGAGAGGRTAPPPPSPAEPRLPPADGPPGGASGPDGGSGGGGQPAGAAGGAPRSAAAGAAGGTGEPSSSSDSSSESRAPDPALLRELDAVENQLRQIGSCLQEIQRGGCRGRSEPVPSAPPAAGRHFIPRRDGDSDDAAAKRKSAECEDASPPHSPVAAGPSVHARLEGIKTALEQVISPERQALSASALQSSAAPAAGDTDSRAPAPAAQCAPDNDSECIYGIPAEVADAPGRRVRLSQLFSSFGKGLRRRSGARKERRAHSQFYVDLDRSDSDSSGLEQHPRPHSDPSLDSSSSGSGTRSSSETVVMGGTTSQPEKRVIPKHQLVKHQPADGCLQYARVIQEFSSNLQNLCRQVPNGNTIDSTGGGISDEAPDPDPATEPPPPPAAENSDSDSESETLHTACDQPPPSPDASRSFLVAKEMMTSEETFVDALRLLNEDFRAAALSVPPDASPAGIPAADLDQILVHLPSLQKLNEELLADLRARVANWSRQPRIADVIVRKGPFLKLYSAYIHDFQAQSHMLDDCRSRYPGFDAAVTKFEASPRCQKLSVKHYMLKPVQRLPQYRLLLQDYLRRLEVGSDDYDNTLRALEVVCEVAEHANKSMKEGDNFRKLLQLQDRLRYTEIVKPGRTFLREGELMKQCRKGPQPRFVILLTDSLLLTRYSGSATAASGPLNLDYVLPLTGMHISEPGGATDEYQNEFSIVSTARSFSLKASSNKERDEWMDALTGAIEKNTQNRSTFNPISDSVQEGHKLGEKAPVWVPDDRASMCQLCTIEFTVTNRRHHCRACGKVVCGPCSMGKAPLLYQGNSPARVCDVCLEVLQKDVDDSDVDPQNASQSKKSSLGSVGRKSQRKVPKRLEVSANVSGCQMSGYLQRRTRQKWKRFWFVLRDSVLYMYRASQDVVAMDSLPVLGYKVQPLANVRSSYEGVDSELVFQLAHDNQQPLLFHADNRAQAAK
ncbi:FYVE, RhoGEF and PH domain-containing protein 6 [Amphibalanus amphitrite]|uniref:FYVE, RhoGEF and PH domain-containing protein 6 n=1 Tax=Amphibalanus amphitrite TaxID=1232801 RepID=A0A6A4VB64_AMPAM|nr:FYVE, RhoGEF and PH domain-containing protein 6 [Amphibalanus amphitrite]